MQLYPLWGDILECKQGSGLMIFFVSTKYSCNNNNIANRINHLILSNDQRSFSLRANRNTKSRSTELRSVSRCHRRSHSECIRKSRTTWHSLRCGRFHFQLGSMNCNTPINIWVYTYDWCRMKIARSWRSVSNCSRIE